MGAVDGEYTESALSIEELDGQKRRLVLQGSGLPHQGASWKGGQTVKTTWYPGNTEGTQQVLGPREMPSQWEGTWRRTLLSRAPCILTVDDSDTQIAHPHILRDVMEDIFRSGSLLLVTWQQRAPEQRYLQTGSVSTVEGRLMVTTGAIHPEAQKIVRTGRASEWDFPHDRIQDIHWSVTFDWKGRGVNQNRVASTRTDSIDSADQAIADIERQIEQVLAATKIVASNRSIALSASSITLGQLEALADFPQQLVKGFLRSVQQQVNGFNRLLGIIKKIKNTPYELAAMFVDFARNTVNIANQFHDDMTRRSPEQNALDTSVKSLINSTKVFGKTLEQQKQLARAAKEQETRYRKLLSGNPGGPQASNSQTSALNAAGILAVYVTKQGDTPHGVSSKFYDTPDYAQLILQTNHLPWYVTEMKHGTVLVIPVIK